jgi:hypothetical protein
MKFKDAMDKAVDKDKYVRHPDMGKGWTVGVLPLFPGELWSFNPHTGSEYAYTSSTEDRERDDWYVAKNKRDN